MVRTLAALKRDIELIKQAPMILKAKHAEQALERSLALLEELVKRVNDLEAQHGRQE